tara:strand:- start:266 stop:517 length:252 start_codon:yes stop_codon:yes gene_type:complete
MTSEVYKDIGLDEFTETMAVLRLMKKVSVDYSGLLAFEFFDSEIDHRHIELFQQCQEIMPEVNMEQWRHVYNSTVATYKSMYI